ncbi:MAG: hypothetical protein PHZ25_01870 [Candidatus Pacebacteria bacterium]|nr:hypothetical protein [Candidatus Paceibacterota bacterium]
MKKEVREIFVEAYLTVFGGYPLKTKEEWQVAEEILSGDLRKLGEEGARKFLMEVIVFHGFPSEHIRRIVLKAENQATEIFPEIRSDEPHMAELEYIYYKKHPLIIQKNV